MDLFCYEVFDFFGEPVPKIQKISDRPVESLVITAKDMEMFFALLETGRIHTFLEYDKLFQYADKYLIAMVMTYFKRAGYSYQEYTVYNFFVALYLAHDMEEDEEELKHELIRWACGARWTEKHNDLLISRDKLWMSMNYRGVVSKKCCEEVISMLPEHPVWSRQRSEQYGGAKRELVEVWHSESPCCKEQIYSNDSCCEGDVQKSDLSSHWSIHSSTNGKKKTYLIDKNTCQPILAVDGLGENYIQNRRESTSSTDLCLQLSDKIQVTFCLHEE